MKTYTTVDKADWDRGPWDDEPDKMSWTDPTTGLPCLIVRNGGGALCGYVGVNPDHPWHGVDYGGHIVEGCESIRREGYCWEDGHSPESTIRVHGGLTFASGCRHGEDESVGICHIPDPGQPADVWWFGFDCAHYMDVSPAHLRRYREAGIGQLSDEVYRDVGYVREQVEGLAKQLVEVAA